MVFNKNIFIIIPVFCVMTLHLYAQDGGRALYRANKLFEIGNYKEAREYFAQAIESGSQKPVTHYKLGVSYFKSSSLNTKLKGISYLEHAYDNKEGVPDDVMFYLAEIYHKDNQIDKAESLYKEYLKEAQDLEQSRKEHINRKIELCKNARLLQKNERSVMIKKFESPINSEYTEYNPLVTADESMMAYTGLRENRRGKLNEKIYITKNPGDENWSKPKPIDIDTKNNYGTAGISADGRTLIVYIGGANNSGNLYVMEKSGDGWTQPESISKNINSQHQETTASITPDGKTLYFASNRPGGYGGFDIYVSEKQKDGTWGKPENLGPEVNTEYDEDAPFIHPDKKTLFFSSKGHNTMGGNDIFRTYKEPNGWRRPKNLGYPINTTTDDSYFTLTADAETGYFSSERKGGEGGHDIYYFKMPEDANIPLTLVKGRILAGEDPHPVPTKIKVVDKSNNEEIEYVYNPDPETGNYLIILPPGKNYDLIIESEGYLPYTVNVNIPNQDYFYELYQEIYLKPVKQFGVTVGQKVDVKNAFYDTDKRMEEKKKRLREAKLIKSDSVDLYDMMETVIAASDTAAYEYLLDLMYATKSLDSVDFSESNEKVEAADVTYYYDETGKDDLVAKPVGNDTIYTLPTFYVTEEAIKQREKVKAKSDFDKKILEKTYKVYFGVDKSNLEEEYKNQLEPLVKKLEQHPALGIQISGYASPEGNEEYNKKLSNERAKEVLSYFNQKGVVRRRIVAKGYGSTEVNTDEEESRRVEVTLIDLNEYDRIEE